MFLAESDYGVTRSGEKYTWGLYCQTIRAVLNNWSFQETCLFSLHLAKCHHFFIEKQNISRGKFDIFEILILLFDFSYFDIEML